MNAQIPRYIVLSLALVFAAQSAAARQPQQNSGASPALSPRDMQEERAKLFMAEKRYEDAIDAYHELLKSEPKNALLLNMVGIAYLDLSNFEQAQKYFQRSIKADKKYVSAVSNLGMVWYHQKDFRRAIRQYKKAIAIDPRQAGTHANLGFAYYNSNKFPEAAAEFQKAADLDPHIFEHSDRVGVMVQDRTVANHGQFFYMMARVYAQKGDPAHCAAYLRKSMDEGYKDIKNVKTDPAFKDIIDDPGVQAVLVLIFPAEQKADAAEPGA